MASATDNNIQINNFQVALFLKSLYVSQQPLEFATKLTRVLPFLDGSPMILPVPQDAPLIVPRIILSSQNKQYSCNISSIRFDLFINNMGHTKNLQDLKGDFFSKVNLLINFVETEKFQVNRIGFVTNMQFKMLAGMTSAEYIKDHFTKNINAEPREMILKFLYRTNLSSIDSNVSIQMNQKGSGLKLQENLLLLQTDINTIPDLMSERVFSPDETMSFLNEAFIVVKSKKEDFPEI